MKGLKDKVALVTGGTSGIGRATAIALAEAGTHVVLTGRRDKEGEQVAEEVRKRGVKSVFVRGDITDERHVQKAVETAVSIRGRLDLAFNNAGIELMGVPVAESTIDQFRQVMEINVLGVQLSMKHQIRAMLGTQRAGTEGGAIVNNASVAGRLSMPGMGIYSASKHAVLGMTKAAALEMAPRGIRVNAVSPGPIVTDMYDRFMDKLGEGAAEQVKGMIPMGRAGNAEEIAAPVLFLLSDAASFITGHDLVIDGGISVP